MTPLPRLACQNCCAPQLTRLAGDAPCPCAAHTAFDGPRRIQVSDRGRGAYGHDLEVGIDPVPERRPARFAPQPGEPPERAGVHRRVRALPGRCNGRCESSAPTARTLASASCPVSQRQLGFRGEPRRRMSRTGPNVPSRHVARVDIPDGFRVRTAAFACCNVAMESLQFATLNA
jgi:hypothetical protein